MQELTTAYTLAWLCYIAHVNNPDDHQGYFFELIKAFLSTTENVIHLFSYNTLSFIN